jgi:hypothetical protein
MKAKGRKRAAAAQAVVVIAARAAEARANLGHAATAYAGLTPTTIDGRPVMHSNGIGWGMRSREAVGTTIRAGKKGGLKLVRPRYDAGAPKRGGAHLAAGDSLVRDAVTGAVHICRAIPGNTTTRVPTSKGIMHLRSQVPDRVVTLGDDDAPVHDEDVGDTDADLATARYFTRRRIERGDIRPEDIDPATGRIKEV